MKDQLGGYIDQKIVTCKSDGKLASDAELPRVNRPARQFLLARAN